MAYAAGNQKLDIPATPKKTITYEFDLTYPKFTFELLESAAYAAKCMN